MNEKLNSYELKIVTDDVDDLKMYTHAQDMYLAITDTLSEIRARLKYEDIPEAEEEFLEELQSALYVEGIGL